MCAVVCVCVEVGFVCWIYDKSYLGLFDASNFLHKDYISSSPEINFRLKRKQNLYKKGNLQILPFNIQIMQGIHIHNCMKSFRRNGFDLKPTVEVCLLLDLKSQYLYNFALSFKSLWRKSNIFQWNSFLCSTKLIQTDQTVQQALTSFSLFP